MESEIFVPHPSHKKSLRQRRKPPQAMAESMGPMHKSQLRSPLGFDHGTSPGPARNTVSRPSIGEDETRKKKKSADRGLNGNSRTGQWLDRGGFFRDGPMRSLEAAVAEAGQVGLTQGVRMR